MKWKKTQKNEKKDKALKKTLKIILQKKKKTELKCKMLSFKEGPTLEVTYFSNWNYWD